MVTEFWVGRLLRLGGAIRLVLGANRGSLRVGLVFGLRGLGLDRVSGSFGTVVRAGLIGNGIILLLDRGMLDALAEALCRSTLDLRALGDALKHALR